MKTFIISNDHGMRVCVRAPSTGEAVQALADERKAQKRPMSRDELGRSNIRVAREDEDTSDIETIGGDIAPRD